MGSHTELLEPKVCSICSWVLLKPVLCEEKFCSTLSPRGLSHTAHYGSGRPDWELELMVWALHAECTAAPQPSTPPVAPSLPPGRRSQRLFRDPDLRFPLHGAEMGLLVRPRSFYACGEFFALFLSVIIFLNFLSQACKSQPRQAWQV